MKNINKKLYSVIVVCLLILCFSLNALATESSDISALSSSTQDSVTTSSNTADENASESDSSEFDENTSSNLTDSSSIEGSDLSSTESDLSNDSNFESGDQEQPGISSDATSSKTSSKHGNIGGYVNDEADTSGWGGDDVSSQLVSAGTTEKKENKKITDYTSLLWILMFIPILLIIASIGALVYVNRKAFLNGASSFDDSDDLTPPKRKKISAAEKAKIKNNHKNRTNVYKPRD